MAGSFILILVADDAARVLYLALSVIGCVGVAVLLLVRCDLPRPHSAAAPPLPPQPRPDGGRDVPEAAPEGLLDKVEEEEEKAGGKDGVDAAALAETTPPEVSVRATLRLLLYSPQMFLIAVSVFYNGLRCGGRVAPSHRLRAPLPRGRYMPLPLLPSIGYVFGDFTEFVITPALTSPDETPKYTGFIIAIFYATDALGPPPAPHPTVPSPFHPRASPRLQGRTYAAPWLGGPGSGAAASSTSPWLRRPHTTSSS